GNWEVIELVESGKKIPQEAIAEWLPSGGKFEITDNAILSTGAEDGKKHVKIFSIDSTQYPKGIDLSSKDQKDAVGIYRFDGDQLILCFADPETSKRPTEFSAKENSNQILMTLKRPAKAPAPTTAPAKVKPSSTAATVLTDAQVKELLVGTWKYTDQIGALFVIFNSDGTFRTVREVQEIRLFQKMFVQTPISNGNWKVENGELSFRIRTSVQKGRAGKEFDFAVRSISKKDFIFTDNFGRVGQAARVK
ncbi:MAG: TIGR03067 domain-containing protein, partial [Planctomycetaceae bacterium]